MNGTTVITESVGNPSGESRPVFEILSRSRPAGRLFVPLLLLTCGTIMAMDRADPDLWGHIQYGREVLRDGALPTTSTWNYTAPDYRWINHENLAELVMAATYDSLGTWGLSVGKFALSLLVIGLLIRQGRARRAASRALETPAAGGEATQNRSSSPQLSALSPLTVTVVALAVAISVEFHWHFRPQIFGYACAALLMAVLSSSIHFGTRETPQPFRIGRSIWFAVPIMLLWANAHGSFLAGLCLLWSYFGLLALQDIGRHGRLAFRGVALLAGVATASTMVTFVNPYGIRLHLWLWEALHIPRPEIWDWQPLELLSREAVGFWVILTSTATATWMTYFSKDRQNVDPADRLEWPKVLVLALVGTQAVIHVRHLPLLAIIWGFWIQRPLNRLWEPIRLDVAGHLAKARQTDGRRDGETEGDIESGILAPFLSVLALCLWAGFVGSELGTHLSAIKVDRDQFPVDAMAFLAEHKLEGKTVVTFNWAQYAIAVFAETGLDSTVAFDGRFRTCYPQEVIDMQFDFLFGQNYSGPRYRSPKSPSVDPKRALQIGDPELVLISRKQLPSVRTMQSVSDEWVLLYQDGLAQIWGRRDLFDNRHSPRYLPSEQRVVSDELAQGWVEWPAIPKGQNYKAALVGID